MIDTLVRVTFVSLAAAAGLLAARRASSALRHWICFVALAACLAIPLLARWGPALELAVLAAPAPRAVADIPESASWTTALLSLAWLLGAVLRLARWARGIRAAHRVCRSAVPASRSPLAGIAARARSDLGLRRRVRLLFHDGIDVPFAWGFFRPVVVLPASATRWAPGQARAILLHELAHIRRRDCWARLVADLSCVVFWFHPVVRVLAREMRLEQEAACDDRVLTRGARPSGYASLLLRTVRSFSPQPLAGVAAFGFRSGLERRIRSLLQPGRSRQLVTSDDHFWVAAAALALVLPAAATRLVPARADAPAARPAVVAAAAEPTPKPAPKPAPTPTPTPTPPPKRAAVTPPPSATPRAPAPSRPPARAPRKGGRWSLVIRFGVGFPMSTPRVSVQLVGAKPKPPN